MMRRRLIRTQSFLRSRGLAALLFLCLPLCVTLSAWAGEALDPEATLRRLVQANADRDLATMAKYMAKDSDVIGYTINGQKYVGWPPIESEMRYEFEAVAKLEIPILSLHMWRNGDVAWFAMELDYIRYTNAKNLSERIVMPLRETGVLERRNGDWILVSWHESSREADLHLKEALANMTQGSIRYRTSTSPSAPTDDHVDLSGEWEVTEVEDNKVYKATLDAKGNGPYTWQEGRFTTTDFNDRRWQGTWKQPGNDREGAFEIVLSEDHTEARGIWWYVRVGTRTGIPPRQHGGTYIWKRLTPPPVTP